MANYSSVQSGNWSDVNTWGGTGYPSQDNDTATVNAGHIVNFDIDLTSLTTGLGTITINGTLKFNSNTGVKMNGNFAGSGWFIIGEEGSEVENVKILVNGNYSCTTTNQKYFGVCPVNWKSSLAFDYPAGTTQIQFSEAIDLQANDYISISRGLTQGNFTEAGLPYGSGIYQVQSYNAETKTATLVQGLVLSRSTEDRVEKVNRSIWIHNLLTSGWSVRWSYKTATYQSIWFNNWKWLGAIYASNIQANYSYGSNNTNGVFYSCFNGSFQNNSGINNTNGVFYYCFNGSFQNNSGINNTNGVFNYCFNGSFQNNSGINNTNGVFNSCFNGSFQNNSGINNTYGVFHRCFNGSFQNNSGINNTNGVFYYCFNGSFLGISNNINQTEYLFNSFGEMLGESNVKTCRIDDISYYGNPRFQVKWKNFDEVGFHRVFSCEGIYPNSSIRTYQVNPNILVFEPQRGTIPVILDFPFIARKNKFIFKTKVKKSISMSKLPRICLLKEGDYDPDDNNQFGTDFGNIEKYLACSVMTDSIDTWEELRIEKDLTIGEKYKIRYWVFDSAGQVFFEGSVWMNPEIVFSPHSDIEQIGGIYEGEQ